MTKRRPLQTPRPPRAPALTRGGRWAVRLTRATPPLIFLGATVFYGVQVGRLLSANLSPVLAAEVTRQTGHETRLGRVHFSTPGTLSIDDVAFASRSTFAQGHGEAALRAARLTVHYDLRALLFDSANAAHAVGDVVMLRPAVLVERLSKTQFNFTDLLNRPQTSKTKPFVGQVLVRDGSLRFRDYLAPAGLGARPALNALAHVNATVNLHSEQTAYFAADGQGTAGRLAAFRASGDASRLVKGRFRADGQVTDADAAYWARYFASSPAVRVTAGRVDLDVSAARLDSLPPPGLPVDLTGRVTVRRAALAFADPQLRRLALRGLTGSAVLTGDGLAFNAAVAANGQAIIGSGTVFDFARPQLALSLTSRRLDVERVARIFPAVQWPAGLHLAPGPATVSVLGPAARPTFSADVALPGAQYAGNVFSQVRAAAVLAGKTLTLPGVTLRTAGGGQVALRGTVVLGKAPQVSLAAQARGVDLAALHLPGSGVAKLNLGGLADVQALADNAGHPLRLTANVAVARPRVSRTQLLSARARVVYEPGQGLTLSRALVRAPQGAVSVSGTVPTGVRAGQWGLSVDAAGLDLNALAGPYTPAPIGGAAFFQGRVVGPAGAPRAVGQVQLINPRYARFTADVVRGGLSAGANGLRLSGLTLNLFPAEARVSGTVTDLASANPSLDLSVRLSRADVQDFVNIAGQFAPPAAGRRSARSVVAGLPPITGIAQGTFQIGGTAHAPRVAGQATIADATVGPYRVDRLSAQADFQGGTVRVAGLTAKVEGATLSARGALGLKTGRLQAVFTADGLDLERVRSLTLPFADVDGLLGVSGRVGGTLKDPAAAATLTGRGLVVDGQALAPLTLAARYQDGVLVQTGPPWVLDILPPVATPGGPAAPAVPDIRYVVSALRLSLPTPAHPRRAPSLALDAALPPDAPERVAHLIQTLRASRFALSPAGRRLLARIDALPRPLGGTLAVPRLAVRGPLAAPSVQATVQASGLTLGPDRLGSLTADLGFTDSSDPQGKLSLRAGGLLAAGAPVDDVTAEATLAHHVLTVGALRATSARSFLEASGRADIGKGGTLDATLDAGHLPLSLLNTLLPPADALTGEVSSLSVSASGPTLSPDLTASINLADPGLALTAPADAATHRGPVMTRYALDRIRSGAITVTTPVAGGGQVLNVTDLAAFKGGRPVASLSGTLPFRWHGEAGALPDLDGQPLHAQFVAQDLSLLAPFVPALDPARTAGTLTAGLDVTVLDSSAAADTVRVGGTLDLTGGAVGQAGFDTALNRIEAHLSLADGVVKIVHATESAPGYRSAAGGVLTVRRFTAASTKGGTVAVTGGGTLQAAHFQIAASGLTVDETSRQNVLARTYGSAFQGTISGALAVVGPWLTPLISTADGAPLVVSSASGTIPSASAPAGPASAPSPFDPRLSVTVLLGAPGRTITISNALLRADASGNVELTGALSDPRLRAHLTVGRGQLILPPATRLKFARSVEGNTVNVRYPVPDPSANGLPGLQTQVNLTAEATVSVSQSQLAAYRPAVSNGVGGEAAPLIGNTATTALGYNQAQRYTITAHIHGVLNDPNLQIDLESSPAGLSRQDMLIALTGAPGLSGLFGPDAQAAFQAELAQALSSVAVPALLTPLENSIAQSLSLSDFDVAYAPDAPVLVTLSKELAPRLEATYIRSFGTRTNTTSSLGQPPQYTLKLGYGLTRRLQVTVSTDDQRNNTIALESVLRF